LGLTGAIFLAGFAIGCMLAFARHPIYGLLTYVAVYYLSPSARWWGQSLPDLRWSLFAAAVTLLAVFVSRKKMHRPAVFGQRIMIGLLAFLLWIAVQSFWALDIDSHLELLALAAKYVLLVGLIYACVDSEKHLRFFLWAHVLGCFYLGWLVYTTYIGGRFEDFGGADIGEANSGALQIVTGIFAASALFLAENARGRIVILGCMPFIVNALVATISRSAFLAAASGGIMFNVFTPARMRTWVRVLSVLAVIMFFMLTNPLYWSRIESITEGGADVEGVDTGSGRLKIIAAQWRMFSQHPLGCGHRCTAVLSRHFLSDQDLTGEGDTRARSSHNTVMTLLVEHGVPGVLFYGLWVLWVAKSLRTVLRKQKKRGGFLPTVTPALAAVLVALIVGDMFVDYLILEVRMWFMALLMVALNMNATDKEQTVPEKSRRASARHASRGAPLRGPVPISELPPAADG
jgi:O-Antigen ligase